MASTDSPQPHAPLSASKPLIALVRLLACQAAAEALRSETSVGTEIDAAGTADVVNSAGRTATSGERRG